MNPYPYQQVPRQSASGRIADAALAATVGLLAAGIKALCAVGLVLTQGSAATGPNAIEMSRMAVWGFLGVPAIVYFSVAAGLGASALWTGAPSFGWFGRSEMASLLTPVPSKQVSLLKAAGRGALGGLIGLAVAGVLIVAWLVICIVMVFLGPGPAALLLWLFVVLGTAAGCALWGSVIGTVVYIRRRHGWVAAVGASVALIVACNYIVGWAI